ncbi:MAG TPA: ASCH domain-containing protein [Kofleriaceae bacterium]|nr:ASCH domain-containing protein [Kofleriaceae bacterium]
MLAMVLDRTHAVLLDGDRLPRIDDDGRGRPLLAVESWFAARGVTLPAPAGSRPAADGGRDLVFVTARLDAPAGMAWVPLAAAATDDVLWRLYVERVLGGWEPPTRDVDVWSFGDQPEMASRLAHLVACGDKRVTMGWVEAAKASGTPLARTGGVSVVTDAFGYPRLVLRTTRVDERPFDAIDAALAADEGEGDLSHADWREGHVAYFTREAARHRLAFADDAIISVETFEVLHVVGAAAPGAGTPARTAGA